MDIIPNKKSKLLYQRGDQKIKGVIDLRCFSDEKKEIIQKKGNGRKTVFEIIKKESDKKEFSKQTSSLKSKLSIFNKSIHLTRSLDARCLIKRQAHAVWRKLKFPKNKLNFSLLLQKSFFSFVSAIVIVSLMIFSLSFIQNGIEEKEKILGASTRAYDYLKQAGQSASSQDFENSIDNFDSAKLNFLNIKTSIESFGLGVSGTISNLPINTPISTAKNLAGAGESISLAGKNVSAIFEKISKSNKENFSINFALNFQIDIDNVALNLKNAENNLNKVDLNYIQEKFQEKIKLCKEELPVIAKNFKNLSEDFQTMAKIFGNDRSQKYLILFQNNSEIRGTGGFIGSYGILEIENGKIKNFFIDGIFNPDGQLKEKIIPPMPIQKISAAWSMHDANW
ncbi:MAG: DUF4012 domain-containing protein, partial [Candidatus Pacebacteria bacterium]|nr:DUF4012 domain-containing protein [Candidatus Paceibacterota bacterium]